MGSAGSLEELRGHLERFLRASYGDAQIDEDRDFVVRREGVVTWVRPLSKPDAPSAVVIWSVSNLDCRVDPDLTRLLATEGNNLTFGQFELYESPSRVNLSHVLLGDQLSREELQVAVDAVSSAAARYGPLIKERFGGRLFAEGRVTTGIQVQRPADLDLAAAFMETLLRGSRAEIERKERRARSVRRALALAAPWAGLAAAVATYLVTSSWALPIFVLLMTTYLVGRGLPDVILEPRKMRRALYFATMPAIASGIVWVAYRWWDRMWLAVLLGLVLGFVLGAAFSVLLFPRIAAEEIADPGQGG